MGQGLCTEKPSNVQMVKTLIFIPFRSERLSSNIGLRVQKLTNYSASGVYMYQGPLIRSDFKNPILGSENWTQVFTRSDFKLLSLSASFIFQEEYWIKIENVLFPSVFSKLRIRVSEGHFYCVHCDPIFGTNKIRILEIGSCEQAKLSSIVRLMNAILSSNNTLMEQGERLDSITGL